MNNFYIGLYKILNYISENQCYFVGSYGYDAYNKQLNIVKGEIIWRDNHTNFRACILENHFLDLFDDICRELFYDDLALENFKTWLVENDYLLFGLDEDKNIRPVVTTINGIPSLCVCINIDVDILKNHKKVEEAIKE